MATLELPWTLRENLSYEDLLISKEKLARAKDMEDIKELGLRKGRRPK